MKKVILLLAVSAITLLSSFTVITTTKWKITDGFSIKFTSKDPSGIFKSLRGDLDFDENNLETSRFDVTVDVASINTGNGLMNKLAKGRKWFDVEHYPTIKFTSHKISKTAAGFEAVGTLDMHGIQKQIIIPFMFKNNTFSGSFTVNRLDYKVGTDDGIYAHASKNLLVEITVPVQK